MEDGHEARADHCGGSDSAIECLSADEWSAGGSAAVCGDAVRGVGKRAVVFATKHRAVREGKADEGFVAARGAVGRGQCASADRNASQYAAADGGRCRKEYCGQRGCGKTVCSGRKLASIRRRQSRQPANSTGAME